MKSPEVPIERSFRGDDAAAAKAAAEIVDALTERGQTIAGAIITCEGVGSSARAIAIACLARGIRIRIRHDDPARVSAFFSEILTELLRTTGYAPGQILVEGVAHRHGDATPSVAVIRTSETEERAAPVHIRKRHARRPPEFVVVSTTDGHPA